MIVNIPGLNSNIPGEVLDYYDSIIPIFLNEGLPIINSLDLNKKEELKVNKDFSYLLNELKVLYDGAKTRQDIKKMIMKLNILTNSLHKLNEYLKEQET